MSSKRQEQTAKGTVSGITESWTAPSPRCFRRFFYGDVFADKPISTMVSVTHGLYFSSIFFFKVLFQKLFEVNVQNVQKSKRDCLLAFNPPPFLLLRCFLLFGGAVGCGLLPKEGDSFSIVNVSNWTSGPWFFLQLIQSPVKSSFPLRFPSLK